MPPRRSSGRGPAQEGVIFPCNLKLTDPSQRRRRAAPVTNLLGLARDHRREFLLATVLVVVTAALVYLAPLLFALALIESRSSVRRRGVALAALRLLAGALAWAWRQLRGLPRPGWHPCAHCGSPIEPPSRACYCSPACGRNARLQRDLQAFDPRVAERAQRRLRLREEADLDPELLEIPF